MNFIKSVAGKLDDPMQNAKLDKINDRRVDQYDREIDELIRNQHHMYTAEEVAHLEQEVIDHCLNDYDKEAVPYIGRAVHENWREGGGDNLEVRKRMLLRELEKRRGRLGAAVTEVNNRTRAELEGYFQRIGQSEGIIQESLPTDFGTIVNHYSHLKNELAGAITAHHHQGYDHYDTFVHHQLGNALRDAQNRTVDSNRAKHHEREVDALAQSLSRLHTAEEAEDLERLVVDNTFRAWGEETAGGQNIDERREVLGNRLQEKRGIITNAVNETNARIRGHLDGYVAHINTAEEQIKATLPTEVEKIENHFNELRQQLEGLIVPTYNGGFDQFNVAVHNELQVAVDAHRERVTAENDRLRQQALEGYVAHINAYEEQIKGSFPTDAETINNHFNELRQQLQSVRSRRTLKPSRITSTNFDNSCNHRLLTISLVDTISSMMLSTMNYKLPLMLCESELQLRMNAFVKKLSLIYVQIPLLLLLRMFVLRFNKLQELPRKTLVTKTLPARSSHLMCWTD